MIRFTFKVGPIAFIDFLFFFKNENVIILLFCGTSAMCKDYWRHEMLFTHIPLSERSSNSGLRPTDYYFQTNIEEEDSRWDSEGSP